MPPKGLKRGELMDLVAAGLVLTLVLVVAFMCLQLYKLHRPPPARFPPAMVARDGFFGTFGYTPACRLGWRGACRGATTGDMPSIDLTYTSGYSLCGAPLGGIRPRHPS